MSYRQRQTQRMRSFNIPHHVESTMRTYLSREQRCKRLELANIPFIEREQQHLDPLMRGPVQCIQYWVHQLRFIMSMLPSRPDQFRLTNSPKL